MSDEEFLEVATPFFEKSAVYGKYDIKKIAKLIKSRVEILSEIPEKVDFIANCATIDNNLYENQKQKTSIELAKVVIPACIEKLKDIEDFSNSSLFENLAVVATELEIKSKQLFWILRIALTGMLVTPGGATEIAEILGKEECLNRLNNTLSNL